MSWRRRRNYNPHNFLVVKFSVKDIINKALGVYQWLLSLLLKIKIGKVNRKQYLTSVLKKYLPEDDGSKLELALNGSLSSVLTDTQLRRIYRHMMWRYGALVFTVSFVLTLTPDILWITLLAGVLDLAVFQLVLFIAMQKIMILHGQNCDLHSNAEEDTRKILDIDSSGLMLGKHPILQKLKSVSGWVSKQLVQRIGPRIIARMSRPISIILRRQGLKWLSVVLTKENLDIALAAVVPLTCAFISGIVSVVIFVPMCNKLRKHLLAETQEENCAA